MSLLLLSASLPVRLSAQVIDTVVVVNRNVFDLEADGAAPGFLARLANALHVRTHPWVIRRALLVNPGDPYDSARVAESERALLGLFVFSRVRLDTVRIRGRLALRVETTDGWSTKPQLGYSSAGGAVSWLAGLVEENLLGTATSLTAVYNKTPDRSIFDLGYLNPHFVGRRARLQGEYASKSDAKRGVGFGGVPFYVTAPRAWAYPADQAGVGRELSWQVGARWSRGFATLRGAANGVYGANGLDSGRVAGSLTVASQSLPRQTLLAHLEGRALRRPNPGAEFDLWLLQKGPRVFGIHQFTGTRMVWVVVEDRVLLSDELWGLVGVGVAPFLDYGGAWYAEGFRDLAIPTERPRLGGDVGLSLRFGPTHAVRGDVGEIAIGYRFGQGGAGSRWGLSIRKGLAF